MSITRTFFTLLQKETCFVRNHDASAKACTTHPHKPLRHLRLRNLAPKLFGLAGGATGRHLVYDAKYGPGHGTERRFPSRSEGLSFSVEI
jgi:hypothetical protein